LELGAEVGGRQRGGAYNGHFPVGRSDKLYELDFGACELPSPTLTPTATPTVTQSGTPTFTSSDTPTGTLTQAPTATATFTATFSATYAVTPLATATPTPTATSTPAGCTGDCNTDSSVTVDEILTMVSIALGNTPVSDCDPGDANDDGQITVDEILTAVNNALSGCVQGP
jgi:hypothetical protein